MRSADLPTAPFFRELRADKERSKETPMKNTSLLLTVSRNGSKVTKSHHKNSLVSNSWDVL